MARQPMSSSRSLVVLAGVVLAVTVLWHTPFIWPLKILTVFFHEISHGLACWATGGTIGTITISMNEGGLHWGAGGSRFLVLNAGYVGSLVWGCGLLLLATWVKRDAVVVAALGFFLAGITLVCVRNMFGFGFGLGTALALLVMARYSSQAMNEIILQIIGTTSALYVIPDVWSDVMRYPGRSDATMLADYTHIPAVIWGGAWLVVSIFVCFTTLRWVLRATR